MSDVTACMHTRDNYTSYFVCVYYMCLRIWTLLQKAAGLNPGPELLFFAFHKIIFCVYLTTEVEHYFSGLAEPKHYML